MQRWRLQGLECDALPFSEGGVIRLDVALLTDPDLSTSDLHSDQREALLQGPSVHDGLDVQLLATEPLLQTEEGEELGGVEITSAAQIRCKSSCSNAQTLVALC